MEAVKKTGQANLVAVSDCYQGHLTRAKERTDGKIDTNFAQYKTLLDRKDIDAVSLRLPTTSICRWFWTRSPRARTSTSRSP